MKHDKVIIPLTWTKMPEGRSVKKAQFDILTRTKDMPAEKTDPAISKAQRKRIPEYSWKVVYSLSTNDEYFLFRTY